MLRFLLPLALLAASSLAAAPNIVIIYADDLGYGDLGVYGHPSIRTPNLDRMAAEGSRWTSFYVAASVCTPSRAGLMTGRHPLRSGTMGNPRVFAERSLRGLPFDEVTIAEMLKPAGYATGMVGKWHLGHMPGYLPTRQGFDEYFGLVSSNDHNKQYDTKLGRGPAMEAKDPSLWDIPLMDGEEVVEKPADQTTLTRRYTARAVDFIERHVDQPFFLYFAHTFPHTPLFRSEGFAGRSDRGVYGDVVEELDWSVGKVLDTIRSHGLAENTLVVFSSDNGPWLPFEQNGGSAGLLREGKGCTWEGGMRVPGIFWQPGSVRRGVVRDIGSTLDILPTVAALTGAKPPDRTLDGYDLSPALLRGEPSPRKEMVYYRGGELFAYREGPYKIHFWTQTGYTEPKPTPHDPPALYHLEHDPGEKYDISAQHPDVVRRLVAAAKRWDSRLERGPDQLSERAPGPVGVFTHPPVSKP